MFTELFLCKCSARHRFGVAYVRRIDMLQGNAISVPVEITAGQILITFWDTDVRLQKSRTSSLSDRFADGSCRYIYGRPCGSGLSSEHIRSAMVWGM